MRLFITGISGLLGVNLALLARDRHRVSGCYLHHQVSMDGVEVVRLDLTHPGPLEAAIGRIEPDVIIHTAGLTNVDECEANPKLARRLNVDVAGEVARVAAERQARLVYVSSDHLFAGTLAWHDETDRPAPVNVYARTKVEAETLVQAACPQALIVRTNFFGWGTPVRTSFSDWILAALRRDEELRMFTDVFFTPILINDLGEVILELLSTTASGLYHVAGGERLSKHDFAQRLAEVFDVAHPRIRPASVEEAPLRARRPKDMSLRTDKVARLLGRRMPAVGEGLAGLRRLEGAGWPNTIADAVAGAHLGARE